MGLRKKEQFVLCRREQVSFTKVFWPWNREMKERGEARRGGGNASWLARAQLPSSSIWAPFISWALVKRLGSFAWTRTVYFHSWPCFCYFVCFLLIFAVCYWGDLPKRSKQFPDFSSSFGKDWICLEIASEIRGRVLVDIIVTKYFLISIIGQIFMMT